MSDPRTIRQLLDAGRPKAAVAAARRALAQSPDDGPLLHAAARAAAAAGTWDAAQQWLGTAIKLAPRDAMLWVDAALVAFGSGRGKAFEKELRKRDLPAQFTLALKDLAGGRGTVMRGTGAVPPAAVATAQQALRAKQPKAAEAALGTHIARAGAIPLALLAQARQMTGNLPGAVQALTQAAKQEPWVTDLRMGLAQLLAQTQGAAVALPHAIEAARLAPKSGPAAILAARLARAAGARALLPRLATQAIERAPRDPGALLCAAEAALSHDPLRALTYATALPKETPGRTILVAQAQSASGNSDAALESYGSILTEYPTDLDALTARAQLLQSLGRADEAEADLRAAIRAHPAAGLPLRALAYGTKLTLDDPAIESMRAATEGPNARLAHYALARALDRIQPDAAEAHLETANSLQAEAFPFDPDADLAELARVTGPLWTALAAYEPSKSTADPVFVTGLPRSGTTLVERVLSAHPALNAGGELGLLQPALAPLYDAIEGEEAGDLAKVAETYSDAVRRKAGPGRVTDKSIHSFLHIGAIVRAMPRATIIVVRRDPRDTGLSIWKNHFPDGTHRYAASMEGIAEHIALFEVALDHWRAVLPGAFHEVAYEDLIAFPEAQSRTLLDACGLPWDDQVLRFHEAAGRVDTLSFDQVRRPINAGSVGGWARHERMLRPLLQALERRGLLPD